VAAGFGYSEGMMKQSGHWTEERLHAFLANPQKAVPGTSMQFSGIESQADRENLIAFLRKPKPR
jgi:cytochrome c2